jgi:hypothetical protein
MTQPQEPTRIEAIQARINELRGQLHDAEQELTAERFKDVFRYERGTVVLVPRLLFGQTRMWPARIEGVNLEYTSGHMRDGTPWENHHVSYSVYLQQKDGDFGGSSQGFYHSEVILPPAPVATS